MFRNNRENRERLTVDKPEMQRIILCAVQLDGEFCCQCNLSKSLKIHILIKQLKDQILIPYLMCMTEGSDLGRIEKSAPIAGEGEGGL